jgi:glycosyl transferase family 11
VISFSALGARSRLGNHLFQYAFLRTIARKLRVKFYCPSWIGDAIFNLDDGAERAHIPCDIRLKYQEPYQCTGLNESALQIGDNTDIEGYFQTEKYLDRKEVCRWYTFKDASIAGIRKRYEQVEFENSVGISVRLGDFVTTYGALFYVARRSYYRRALELVRRKTMIVVFSDDIPAARAVLGDLGAPIIFATDYEPYEGVYLQSQCHDFICSASTYSWWGAWLNQNPDRIIIAPKEGAFRPGAPVSNEDFWPENWSKIRALRPLLDHYQMATKHFLLQRAVKKMRRMARI